MRKKKLDKRRAQGAETKKKLYEIAERLFTEHNYDDVNVDEH
jgi:AcrR family transcriptional regulator